MPTRNSAQFLAGCASLVFAAGCLATGHGDPRVFSIRKDAPSFELPERPVFLFFVDGLRRDVLERLAGEGRLPRLQRHLLDRAASVQSAVACVPSVTYANAGAIGTGCWPSSHQVWANQWFDRNHLFSRTYEVDRDDMNLDVARPTLYEDLAAELTAVVGMALRRGVEIPLAVSLASGALAPGLAWTIDMQERADALFAEQVYELGEQARRIGEWPALVSLYLPSVDDAGHVYGCDTPEYEHSVASLDNSIGGLLEAFAEAGLLEKLTVILTSDHGHLPTPHSFELAPYLQTFLGCPVLVGADDDGQSYLARWERYSPERAVLTTAGERQASLHLRAGDHWEMRPTLEEILAFHHLPQVRAMDETSATPDERSLPQLLLGVPAIDFVAVRAGEHEVELHGRRGSAVLVRSSSAEGPRFSYRVLAGSDPLGYAEDERLAPWTDGSAHTSREWLAASAHHRHPDLVPQLVCAFDTPRSGDVLLFAAPGWDFSLDYAGGHGGLEREEMLVPLYIAGPGISAGLELPAARLIDVAPTILDLAGATLPPERRFDGVSLAPELH